MIKYVCKHCGHHMGDVDEKNINEQRLGLHLLTQLERESIITYDMNGDLRANVVCEYCQEAIERNPELSLVSNPLQ